jgi:prepilin-type processing-associated H-X9-DG protein
MEQQALYNQVTSPQPPQATPYNANTQYYPPWGPFPECGFAREFLPWLVQVPTLLCPSDGFTGRNQGCCAGTGDTNYMFSTGDEKVGCCNGSAQPRGVFGAYSYVSTAGITDGTSNTIAMSEAVGGRPGGNSIHGTYVWVGCGTDVFGAAPYAAICLQYKGPGNTLLTTPTGGAPPASLQPWRGRFWQSARFFKVACNTILPPNSVACGNAWRTCLMPPDSNHPGGVNALFADGSTRFISETIDTGNLSAPFPTAQQQSPYGVWGALGSRNGGEAKSL